ncbi:MAG TPA: hypothetical protein VGB91_04575 [Rhizomicrobium sp.]
MSVETQKNATPNGPMLAAQNGTLAAWQRPQWRALAAKEARIGTGHNSDYLNDLS